MSVTYRPAPSVERIAEKIIPRDHPHLADVRVEYVFRSEAAKQGGKTIWGKARKIGGLNAYLAQPLDPDETPAGEEVDFFVIEIAEDVWGGLNAKEREALVDHELCHCITELDKDDELQLKIKPHDLEEFRAVVERHGLWQPDLTRFADSMHYRQMSLDETGDDDMKVAISYGDQRVETTAHELHDIAERIHDDLADARARA